MTALKQFLAIVPALAATAAARSGPPNVKQLPSIAAAYERDDCAPARRAGAAILDNPDNGLSGEIATIVFRMVIDCEQRAGDKKNAYRHLVMATAGAAPTSEFWRSRLATDIDASDWTAAMATLEAMRQGHGAALSTVRTAWMWMIYRGLDKAERATERDRLVQIGAENYAPEAPLTTTDGFRQLRAATLHDRGDVAGARALIAEITTPAFVAELMVDPRFRALLADVDLRDVVERDLAQNQAVLAARPDLLDALVEVTRNLRQLGRDQEALDLLLPAATSLDTPGAYSDLQDRRNWYWDARARSFDSLGRYDEAVADFQKGAAVAEGGSANVSQTINLAAMQVRSGKGDAALKTLSAFDKDNMGSSPYGEMEMRFVRGCANTIAGHAAAAAADLAFARAHERDHPEALADLLLCMGDMEGAASAFIRRLNDPDRRQSALLQLSDYDPPARADRDPLVAGRLPALKARADVGAAIARAGGTRRLRVQAGEL